MNKSTITTFALLFTIATSLFAQVLPGYLTDPSQGKSRTMTKPGSFEIPDELKAPYISTYYLAPTVTPDSEVVISFFVTDWDNSKIRFGDDSHEFNVALRYKEDKGEWESLSLRGLKSGDHEISLGKIPVGDYTLGIKCTDEKGRDSHTVWHEFRCRTKEQLSVTADKIRYMIPEDLKSYGIRNDGDFGKLVPVEVGDISKLPGKEVDLTIRKALDKAVEEGNGSVPAKGYVIYAASHEGVPVYLAWRRSRVVYGKDYNKFLVETNALQTSDGLQRLVDEAARKGYRKFVFLPGTYRVSAHRVFTVPAGMRINLNGATLKMNEFTGDKAVIARIANVRDSHLGNGIIEGDYYEHDYDHSPNNSEWPMGIEMKGDARYCSFQKLVVRNITGYGGGCGMDFTFPGYVGIAGGKYEPGALRTTDGSVDPASVHQYTSDFRDISAFTNKYITVSKYLGYQGIRTRSWLYTAAFYDVNKKFISAERAFQYRAVLIPPKAKYMRVTLVLDSIDEAKDCELTAQLFKTPWNCAFLGIKFERCRAVGFAPAAMRNMLIAGNEFTRSGENLARCAFDAEDGWDMMQDVTIQANRFHDNPNNELLTCAGHNFVIEDNEGDVYLWGRTLSPCVRNNKIRDAGFHCDTRNRTMHGRYLNNTYAKALRLGLSDKPSDWDIVVTDDFVTKGEKPKTFASSPTGRFRDCLFAGEKHSYVGPNFDHCRIKGGEFIMTFVNFHFNNNYFCQTKFSHCNKTGTW